MKLASQHTLNVHVPDSNSGGPTTKKSETRQTKKTKKKAAKKASLWMPRESHTKMVGLYAKARSDPRQHARTPPWIFERLHKQLGFTIDGAADVESKLLPRYWDADDNFLSRSWEGECVYLNPPFCLANQSIEKASFEYEAHGVTTAILLYAKTAGRALRTAIAAGVSLRSFERRMAYLPAPGVTFSSPNRDSMLLVFKAGHPRLFCFEDLY